MSWDYPLKWRGNRVFPKSDHSSDVIHVLTKELQRLAVDILLLHCKVTNIISEKNMFQYIEYQDTSGKKVKLLW